MRTALALVRACHPEPTLAVTTVAAAIAFAAGRGPLGTLAVAAAVLAGQLSIGWSNDYVDRERDRLAHRLDKPVVAGGLRPATLRGAAAAALVATLPLSLLSGARAAAAHMVAVLLAWAYNLRLKSTVLSIVPYAGAFALLPMFISLGLPGAPLPAWWAPVAGGLLGAGAHPLNVLPDIDDDLAGGVRGLPHRLGAAGSRRLAALLLLAATAVLAFGPGKVGMLAVAAAIAGAVLVGLAFSERPRPLLVPADGGTVRAARAGSSRRAFRLVLVLAALDVALLIARGRALA